MEVVTVVIMVAILIPGDDGKGDNGEAPIRLHNLVSFVLKVALE